MMPGNMAASPDQLGTVAIRTHGCKLNQADSETLARQFAQAGYRVVDPAEPADIHIVNTCTVTHVADSKARQALRSAHRKNPGSMVVATGCYAQRASNELVRVQGVTLVAGNTDKYRLVDMVTSARGGQVTPCATGEDPPPFSTANIPTRTRAMVKIQEGCNQVCAYCIVPKVRGRERSIPPEQLVAQLQQLVEDGYKEAVLTGTQLGTYGYELADVNLRGLLELLLRESGLPRLRVSSLQPQEITAELLELWEDPRLCPHFHMPLQSGSDEILNRMRRRYTAAGYEEAVDKIRATVPGASITADVIVGFPGEGDQQFQETLGMVNRMEFASMHVFPYSVRPGTSAAYMRPPVDGAVKRKRMERLLRLERKQSSEFRRRAIGSVRQVLWERVEIQNQSPIHLGLTDNYLKVHTWDERPLLNRITMGRLVEDVAGSLLAKTM